MEICLLFLLHIWGFAIPLLPTHLCRVHPWKRYTRIRQTNWKKVRSDQPRSWFCPWNCQVSMVFLVSDKCQWCQWMQRVKVFPCVSSEWHWLETQLSVSLRQFIFLAAKICWLPMPPTNQPKRKVEAGVFWRVHADQWRSVSRWDVSRICLELVLFCDAFRWLAHAIKSHSGPSW